MKQVKNVSIYENDWKYISKLKIDLEVEHLGDVVHFLIEQYERGKK